jgi:integrase
MPGKRFAIMPTPVSPYEIRPRRLSLQSQPIMPSNAMRVLGMPKKNRGGRPFHAQDVINSLERDLFPKLGEIDIRQIRQPQLLSAFSVVEKRGAIETAHRLRQRAERIFDYADATGYQNDNPARRVKAALELVPRSVRRPALTDIAAIRTLMADVDCASASPITRLGSRFMAITGQRPGMINAMPWNEIEGVDWSSNVADAPDALWRIPADRMKIELDSADFQALEHVVPLAPAAVDFLRAIRPLTGRVEASRLFRRRFGLSHATISRSCLAA